MATFNRLAALDFSGGMNSREEPRGLASNECQDLLNLYPSYPPRPREGVSVWGELGVGGILEAIPFEVRGRSIVFCVTSNPSTVFAWKIFGDESNYVESPSDIATPKDYWSFSWVRVENSLIISADYDDWCVRADYVDGSFRIYPAYIRDGRLKITTASSATAGSLRKESYYSYAVTRIKKVSTISGYTTPLSESPENPDVRRVAFTGQDTSVYLVLEDLEPGDQATHFRLYRTQPRLTEAEAQGASHLWLADIPIGSSEAFIDTLAGSEADPAVTTSALSVLPSCLAMRFHAGRLWVAPKSSSSVGRWLYSAPYTGMAPLFNPSTDFKDTSLFDSQEATGAAVIQDDLYLFSERSIHRIANGDPVNRIEVVSTKVGCPFPGTITESDQWVTFLSARGPYMAQGGIVEPMRGLAAGEVWPASAEGGSLLKTPKSGVWAFNHKQSWIVCSESRMVGIYTADDGKARGAFRVEFADPKIKMSKPIVISDSEILFRSQISRTSGDKILWLFRDGERTDCGYFIRLGAKARRFYVDTKDPSAKAEPYDIRLFASFVDDGQMKFTISGDRVRFNKVFGYEERPKSKLLQPQDIDAGSREVFQQAVPAGLISSFFDVSWEKYLRPPFTFTCMGVEVRVIKRNRPMDSVSVSRGEDAPLDSQLLPFDTTDGGSL